MQSHRIKWHDHHSKWHDMTCRTSHPTSPHNQPHYFISPRKQLHDNKTGHLTTWNSKEMVWASRWSVASRTFYRQTLSLLYSSFPFWNFRPRLARLYVYTYCFTVMILSCFSCGKKNQLLCRLLRMWFSYSTFFLPSMWPFGHLMAILLPGACG